MIDTTSNSKLAAIDHIAIPVTDVDSSVKWYTSQFNCTIEYQDETWAFLKFDNIKLALVVAHQHPPHVAFVSPNADSYGQLKTHRDGSRSIYIKDPAGNSVEIVAQDSVSKAGG
jgi:catechol 2,3-dioxygenase-like lactoylglutathione lyase family enzyme